MKNAEYLKQNGFAIDSVIELFGGMEMYDEILTDFYSYGVERTNDLISYQQTGDMKNYTILVHTMKSECKYLGINYLASLCEMHQLKSEANDVEYINSTFNDLLREFSRVLNIIGKYLGK